MDFFDVISNKYVDFIALVFRRIVYSVVGILIPIQFSWVLKDSSLSSVFTQYQLKLLSEKIGVTTDKLSFFIDSLSISVMSGLFILFLICVERSETENGKKGGFKLIIVCCAILRLIYGMILGA
ncbi:MAG: hypothetical protein N4A40_03025 [Tissierellales bacterium]|jgi:hypothetical protein|nr:hypothetical protein [Tissierellales bacterium]